MMPKKSKERKKSIFVQREKKENNHCDQFMQQAYPHPVEHFML